MCTAVPEVVMGGYDIPDFYLPLLREKRLGGQEGITAHTSTFVTTSGMALLPDEAKLLVGEILEVTYAPLIPS